MGNKILRRLLKHHEGVQTLGMYALVIASLILVVFTIGFVVMCFVQGVSPTWEYVSSSPKTFDFIDYLNLFLIVAGLWLGLALGLVSSSDFKPSVECDRLHADELKSDKGGK